jgi:hypothetical protein
MSEQLVATGSKAEILYAVESSWAELPASPNVYYLRTTGSGLNLSKDNFSSNELRSDRQLAELRTGMKSIAGDINVELIYDAFDDLIESAMFNTWASGGEITIGTTQRSLTIQRGFLDIGVYNAFSGCVVNQWSVSIKPNAVVEATFSFIGKDMGNTHVLTNPSVKSSINSLLSIPLDASMKSPISVIPVNAVTPSYKSENIFPFSLPKVQVATSPTTLFSIPPIA